MTGAANKQIRLASRPSGWVDEQNFAVTEAAIAKPGDGEVLVHNVFMSVDPYMRGRMNDVKSYIPPFQSGDRVFVTAASGAVGSVVGQLAGIHGCRVAGSAGSDDKVALLKDEFGYDEAFNYKTSKSLTESARAACPDGVDVLFENVGGEIFEAVLWNIRDYGRIALCGMIADYNLENAPQAFVDLLKGRNTGKQIVQLSDPE